MSNELVREVWKRFDEAIANAPTPEAKAILEGIKCQTELMNSRLASVDHSIGMLLRQMQSQK